MPAKTQSTLASSAASATSPLIDEFCSHLRQAETVFLQAKRGKQSLRGNNAYAEKFHTLRVACRQALNRIKAQVASRLSPSQQRSMASIDSMSDLVFHPDTTAPDRRDLRREIEWLVRAELEPLLLPQIPSVVELIPTASVANTRGYLEKTVRQINGCHTFGFLDACLTMLRRFFETLVIEVFEAKGLASRVKDANGNYFMFADLLPVLFNEPQTSLSRTTKRTLEDLCELASNAAHNRRFNTRADHIDPLRTRLAIAAEDLITLWGVRG
jgi:hypothetical protein